MTSRDQARRAPIDERKRTSQAEPPEAGEGLEASRLSLIGVKVDIALRREIDAYAEAHGVSRSRAAGHFLAIARDAVREREGVPGSRADEWEQAVAETERELQEAPDELTQKERP